MYEFNYLSGLFSQEWVVEPSTSLPNPGLDVVPGIYIGITVVTVISLAFYLAKRNSEKTREISYSYDEYRGDVTVKDFNEKSNSLSFVDLDKTSAEHGFTCNRGVQVWRGVEYSTISFTYEDKLQGVHESPERVALIFNNFLDYWLFVLSRPYTIEHFPMGTSRKVYLTYDRNIKEEWVVWVLPDRETSKFHARRRNVIREIGVIPYYESD